MSFFTFSHFTLVSLFFRLPVVRSQTRVQLLTGARPLCHFVTFPHTVGNHPFQGSLNNPSVIFAIASLVKGGGPRQGKPEGFCGVIWNLNRKQITFNPSVCSRCSQPAPDGSPSPLSLRDISPHRGESPFTREPKQSLSLLTSFVDSS